MKKQDYTIDYFIKKFEAIPEQDWCIDEYSKTKIEIKNAQKTFLGMKYNGTVKVPKTNFCAQGHCMGGIDNIRFISGQKKKFSIFDIAKSYPELNALINLFGQRREEGKNMVVVALINNGEDKDYQQPTAKQRVLKALYDLKEKETPKDAIKELSTPKELILN